MQCHKPFRGLIASVVQPACPRFRCRQVAVPTLPSTYLPALYHWREEADGDKKVISQIACHWFCAFTRRLGILQQDASPPDPGGNGNCPCLPVNNPAPQLRSPC